MLKWEVKETLMNKDLNNLKKLCKKAKKLTLKTKGAHDSVFLERIFRDLSKKKISNLSCLDVLATIYSVARTTNDNKIIRLAEKLENMNFDFGSQPLTGELQKLLLSKAYGSHKNGNRITSLISKYGFFVTKGKFPISDSYAKAGIRKLANKFDLKKEVSKPAPQEEIRFFQYYQVLLNKLNVDEKFIKKLDAFLWLYGIMSNLDSQEKKQNDKTDWWSGTCGYVGTKEYMSWYKKARDLMEN